jgi:hypothetical protein
MGKVLMWGVLLWAAFWGGRALGRAWRAAPRSAVSAAPSAPPEVMVACAVCGVYVPRSSASERTGQFFCSPAHRDAGSAEGSTRP